MAEILDKFKICSAIVPSLKRMIKLIHVFDDQRDVNVLFVTTDDRVFGFGSNQKGVCGVGHDSAVKEPQLIPQLCRRSVQKFFNGLNFALALTSDGQLFSWGRNASGQLGRNVVSGSNNEVFAPDVIEFDFQDIMDISCGSAHTLVLTTSGQVYGWGDNAHGQVGCGPDADRSIDFATHLQTLPKITSIYCYYDKSFAITENGLVYSWGRNSYCVLGHINIEVNECVCEPRLIQNLSDITTVCASCLGVYFLTRDGSVYFCGTDFDENIRNIIQKSPKLLNIGTTIQSLHSYQYFKVGYPLAVGLDGSNVYEFGISEVIKTNHSNKLDFYASRCKVSHTTLQIEQDQHDIDIVCVDSSKSSGYSADNISESKNISDPGYMTASSNDNKSRQLNTYSSDNQVNYHSFLSCDIYIERHDIEILGKIGEGAFGQVHFGYWHVDNHNLKVEVALKFNKSSYQEYETESEFLDEAMRMRSFRHENVLSLIGMCVDADGKTIVVMPYMRNGDLLSYIRNEQVNLSHIFKFSLDIAQGMNYLAGVGFIHRDLAARNCLLDTDLTVKVSDFGLCKRIIEKTYYRSRSQNPLPIRWTAIESIEHNFFSVKTDVWSYGVTIWELVTRGKTPYNTISQFHLVHYLKSGHRLRQPDGCPQDLYQLCLRCWKRDPNLRPDFYEIVSHLRNIMDINEL